MSLLKETLIRVASELTELGCRWAVVGGLAVSVRSEPRFTRDIDVAVAVSGDADAEALVHAMNGLGYRVIASVEQEAVNRLSTIRLEAPKTSGRASRVVVDLLFASNGIEPEIVEAAEVVEVLPGLRAPVARVGHLIAMKVLARDDKTRPQDIADLRALLAEASAKERERAVAGLRLITARGFNRKRDLTSAWKRLLRDETPRRRPEKRRSGTR